MDLRANAIITAVDRFSGPIQRMAATMDRFAGRAAAVSNASRRVGAAMAGPGSLGAAFGSYAFLDRQLEVERAMNRTQGLLDMTSKTDFQPLRDKIVELGKLYPANRVEIAKGASEMVMAGMQMAEVMATIEYAIQGSMMSQESIRTVAEGVTDVILGMGLAFKTASEQASSFKRVNDLLAAGSTTYNDTYTGLLEAMRRAGPASRLVGTSPEQTVKLIGSLADAGIKNTRAGLALRTIQVRAMAPTARAQEFMRASDIDWSKWIVQTGDRMTAYSPLQSALRQSGLIKMGRVTGARKDLEAILQNPELKANLGLMGDALFDKLAEIGEVEDVQDREKLNNLIRRYLTSTGTKLDIEAMLAELAGKDAGPAVLKEIVGMHQLEKAAALLGQYQSGQFQSKGLIFDKKLEGDPTKRFADIQMQGLPGAWARLSSAFDAFLEKLASSGVIDTVTNAFDRLRGAIDRLGEVDPKALNLLTTGLLAVGVAGPIGLALGGIASGFSAIAAALALPGLAPLLAAGGIAALLGAGDAFKWSEKEVPGELSVPPPIFEYWGRLKDLISEVWGLITDIGGIIAGLVSKVGALFGMDTTESPFIKGLRLTSDFLKSSADSVRVLRENIDAIKSGNFSDLKLPRPPTPVGLAARLVGAIMPQKDDLPPLARHPMQMIQDIKNWNPGKVVDVQGQATITNRVQVEFVNGIPQVANQPGETQQSVPLRTGTSLGDIGAP